MMVREVILETRDGWRKTVMLPTEQLWFRYAVSNPWNPKPSARVEQFDSVSLQAHSYMHFEYSEHEQVKLPDGTIGAIEVWRET